MDVGSALRGLLSPPSAPEQPRPYRRAGGALLVPEQSMFTSGPVLTNFDIQLPPGISESPRLPFENWSFSSFAIPYDLTVEQGPGPDEVATPTVSITLYLAVNHIQVWSADISRQMIIGPTTNRGEVKGTVFSNLAQPISVPAGAAIGFGVAGVFPVLREPIIAGENCNVWFSTQPLQLSYSVEGVNA